jgi:hypothetical protein
LDGVVSRDPAVKHWLSYYDEGSQGYSLYTFWDFYRWIHGDERFRSLSPSGLLEFQRRAVREGHEYELLDTLQKYILQKPGTYNSLMVRYNVVRAFFKHNRVGLPVDSFRIKPSKPPTEAKLTLDIIKTLVSGAGFREKAIYLSLWMGLLDKERFVNFNRDGYGLVKHLKEKGVDEPFLLNYPGRKRSRGRRFCHTYLGHDALVAWQQYFERIRGWPREGEPLILDQFGNAISKYALTCLHLRLLEKLKYIKRGGKADKRYGLHLHEFRDVARTLLEFHGKRDGLNSLAVEFFMGHDIDPNEYTKFYKHPEETLKEYRIAEKYLNIISGKATAEAHEGEIKKFQEQIQKRDQATLEVIERIKKLEERLAKLKGS